METVNVNRLQSLIQTQTNFVIRTDLAGYYTFFNKKYEEAFGWVHGGDLKNKFASESIAPHHRERAHQVVLECIESPGKIIKVELDKLTQNGIQRTSLWEFVCIADSQGNPFEIQCTGIDISEIKQKEIELENQVAEFKHLFDTMIQGVVYHNSEGFITNANLAAQRILGLSLDQLQGRTSIDPRWKAVREDKTDFPGDEHPAMIALRTGKTVENVTMGVYHPDKNDYVWILVSAVPEFKNNELTPYRVYASFTDVTEQRIAREAIESSETKFRILVENLPGATYICKMDETFSTVYMSRESKTVFGREPDAFLKDPKMFTKVIPEPDFNELMSVVEDSIYNQSKYNHTYQVVHPDGSKRWVEDYGEASYNEDGSVQYLIGYAIDVTENREMFRDLKKQNKIQELMTQLSTSFINMPIEEIDQRINEVMASIGEFVDGDRVYIIEYDFVRMVADNSYEWCAEGIEPQIEILQGIPVDSMPEWLEAHINGKSVIIPDVFALPPDDYTRSILEPQGIKSLIAIPMMDGDTCLAFVGIDSVRNHHTYTKYEEIVLRIFADMIVNVRKRKKTLDALANSEERNRNILEVSPVGIGVIQHSKLVYVNPKGCEMLGAVNQFDLINRNITDFLHSDYADQILLMFNDIRNKKEVDQPIETKLNRIDNTFIPIEFSAQLMNYNGEPAYQVVAVDVSVRKQVEEQLKLLSQSIEQSPVYIVITDKEGAIQYVNPSFTRNVGYSNAEMMGKNPRIWKSGIHDNEFYSLMWNTVLSGKQWQGEICNKKKNGELYWEKTIISPVTDENGVITHFISVKEDITVKKQAEKDRLAKQEAEAKSKAKSLFLSNMSHEIRTPLNAVIGFSQLLENDPSLSQRQSEYVYNITRSSKHLLSLIEDILDYTRLEANRMTLNKSNFLIRQLSEDIILMFDHRAKEKGITLTLHLSDSLPEVLESDEAKIRQILINLIGNAVKFTDQGEVSIDFRVAPSSVKQKKRSLINLQIIVKDTGPGISNQDLKYIFEEFRQFEHGLQKGGTGLGMPISKRLIELLEGTIEITSKEGVGTEVVLEIPVRPVGSAKTGPGIQDSAVRYLFPENSTRKKILIVDDHIENQMLLWYVLKSTGFEIKKAGSGAEALSILEHWTPDCILLDIRMPEMSGLEVAEKIREKKIFDSTKIIAISASKLHFGVDVSTYRGIDGFMLKPVNQQSLYNMLGKILDVEFQIERKPVRKQYRLDDTDKLINSLISLSSDDRNMLVDSIKSGDSDQFCSLVIKNTFLQADCKRKLLGLIDAYEYDKILTLLEGKHVN